ncbi:hypothetical protein A3D00_00320 [Candidatus Woesebacteria bacterium RIFCSPHIGHO2_02_FULL_38_9]|uniref:Glycosyltransferase RgtA/B/C/D-like domain-containing protein n=1 Tax=Candidatus Woesebacteria bacterium RIFCSPHIGHO2_01_FULL_39_28 TaxID=1802496 RepID=A0A1F7YK15_9BACT|nr:MAG: hypothetical protein A2627_04575 [Candidatus Woesebacteria bacterium RIFCSPHIGHO2_01_FULL_39_28]OGM33177.1 MAG: hypothetical protein A3D00_00320 [Candidatus Woesebacteria bacterium RIFCSPHIGHO2_02_FULL_38_9]OGM57065.1 MAG: hypothetical protein A3A50_05380 [Candidatus Woesebacteria bacterium RIFCSPLOWO2_01_FULL_38_20]
MNGKKWILLIILLGAFLRFYKLDWGEGYFFHPDEYHIVAAVDRLHFPNQMNPHLFSYGSFIVNLIYFTKLFLSSLNPKFLSLNSFLVGRFYSAFFSTLTVWVVFLISQKVFKNNKYALTSALIIATTPGLIQQAHFTTPESTLIFWLFLFIYFSLMWIGDKKERFLYLSAICLGVAIGTKVTALTLAPLLVLISLQGFKKKIKKTFISIFLAAASFLVVFPYSILDWKSFKATTIYELGLAQGKQIVFYTRQFINTRPVIFQIEKIFPYTLGPLILFVGISGFILSVYLTFKKLKKIDKKILLIIFAFLSYSVPNFFLFAKWTRFLSPTFPFFAIFSVYFLQWFSNKFNEKLFTLLLLYSFTLVHIVWTLMFFSIYLKHDVRITATSWINQNLPKNSFILTESRNMLEVPLLGSYTKIPYEFYDIDDNSLLEKNLPSLLVKSDYFIIQSRRLFVNHLRFPFLYPRISNFYSLLFSGKLGFTEIREFNSYPKLGRFIVPDEFAEETWSVFDHPVIRIYKKINNIKLEDYEKLLKI